jgi:dihydroorotate dehydrogenase electron transfer subunit
MTNPAPPGDLVVPSIIQATVAVLENIPLARATYRIRLATAEISRGIRPGQFLMIRAPGTTNPLLGRPFALYDTVVDARDQPVAVDVVYLVVGKMTGWMAGLRTGDRVEVWGPLGNSFPELEGKNHVALVAGGIGQTPFLAYVRELLGQRGYGGRPARAGAKRVSLFYGVRTAELAAGVEDFRQAGAEVHVASDDGSLGFRGYVTELLESQEQPEHLVGCGPEPMLRALTALARRWQIPCHLSLETPMACGIGICFSCVTRVKTDNGWDYRRVCVEGPIFDAGSLAWEDCATA